jgi:hypothetical protein
MKTIQEELGGKPGRNGRDACKIKNQEMGRKRKRIRKRIVKMRRMNPQAPDLGFKEII